jgi:phage repressor protein C with HTH and peptisase S24 domain
MLTQRLENFITHIGLTTNAFEKSIDTSTGSISKPISGGKGIGSGILEKIFRTYPYLNPAWLMTGMGDMLIEQKKVETEAGYVEDQIVPYNRSYPKLRDNRFIPILDAKAAAGDPYIFDHPDHFRKFNGFTFPANMFGNGNYASIQVRGDSMSGTLDAGDFVLGREVEDLAELRTGDVYIIIYQEDHRPFFVVKRLYYYYGDDQIQLRSDNPAETPRDTYLQMSTVLKFYQVVARFTTTISRANGDVLARIEGLERIMQRFDDRSR